MRKNTKPNFYTLDELDKLIDISIWGIFEYLTEYVKFKGLLQHYEEDDSKKGGLFYADGIYAIGALDYTPRATTSFIFEGVGSEIPAAEQDQGNEYKLLRLYIANNPSSSDRMYEVDGCYYHSTNRGLFSFEEFSKVIKKMGIPLIANESEIGNNSIKKYRPSVEKDDVKITYPPELQLAIDAFEQLCLDQEQLPTIENIKSWLKKESRARGITHNDGSKELKGFSDIKLKAISSIIKSQ